MLPSFLPCAAPGYGLMRLNQSLPLRLPAHAVHVSPKPGPLAVEFLGGLTRCRTMFLTEASPTVWALPNLQVLSIRLPSVPYGGKRSSPGFDWSLALPLQDA